MALLVALVLAGSAGCSGGSAPAGSSPSASPTYQFPPRTVRPFETPLVTASAASGQLSVAVIGIREHMLSIIGTHAEWLPRGEFVRVRIAVQNDSATFRPLDTRAMLLVTGDGVARRPDYDAMNIARQPTTFSLGSQERLELDLWYDVPVHSTLRVLRLTGLTPVREIPLPPT